MYDIERITKIIKDIEHYKRELDSLNINSAKDLEDSRNMHSSSMLCFSILNRVIDLGQEILVKEDYGMPSRYSEIFTNLAKAGFINQEEAKKINELINFRNIIAHTYFELEKKDLLKIIKNINLIETFVYKIKKRISKK
ncbi:MAG: HepT-like ribonuclease domain-containing protein [Nanoarchaeota archaeon]